MAALVRRTIDALDQARFPLSTPGSHELEQSRRRLHTQLQARILPNLQSDELPALVVVGGSSGAGKSTLVNSLVREEISPASVLRPTTRTPVVALAPEDERIMVSHPLGDMATYRIVNGALPGIALIDAPDLDSIDDDNRELSARLLDAADLWVFVTTAARYGDALAWSTLQMAHDRGVTCAVVLDRVPDSALATVRADLVARMDQLGMGESPLFIIPDQGPHSGLLDPGIVADMRAWLETISRTRVGNSLVDRTTRETLPILRADLLRLADGLESQEHSLLALKDAALEAVHEPRHKVVSTIGSGRFGQGAPTSAWLAAASTGGVLAGLAAGRKPSFLDRKKAQRSHAMAGIADEVTSALRTALDQAVLRGQQRVDETWADDIVDTAELRSRAAATIDRSAIVDQALRGWNDDCGRIAGRAAANPWLDADGVASLIGCAAGGIAGARTAASVIGVQTLADEARDALIARIAGALEAVAQTYVATLGDVSVVDSSVLRLRASEFASYTTAE